MTVPTTKPASTKTASTPARRAPADEERSVSSRITVHSASAPAGTQGDPLLSCITGICHYNEDCADHEACDRLNRVCRPVCEEDVCADTATCVGEQHQPKCRCPAGTSGNPYVQCIGLLPPPEPEPSCRSDSDCPSQQACINLYCVNPCASGHVCTQDQECRVLDTLPLRTVMCQCPADTVVDASGRCVQIKIRPECQVDADCSDKDKCIRGSCIEACKVDNCGVNALCNSFNHLAVCSCAYWIQRKCSHSDCTYDKACRGGYCVNPCREDKPCANNAFCSVNNHAPVCKCPAGYVGNPQIECIAPPGPTVGCSSNSECPKSESCINRLCVSPCNCGPNADCKVVNHYATCFCQHGYSGNPQTGCVKLGCQSDTECSNDQQCYNGQCISPASWETLALETPNATATTTEPPANVPKDTRATRSTGASEWNAIRTSTVPVTGHVSSNAV
ncbi:hypothetical protein NQ318_011446 [Aromia moschata]|uniref:EGF-like domain-containing protein n=1 Tax=Aromia moschata TaxID=1265417 RepID=A0AAV8YTG2_9CUCU|nr:hypothetical protein NQ318_011446 [Aromia moschata]